eukprot:136050_1
MSAQSLKLRGNEFFKNKKYTDAFRMYSQAIELDPNNAVYFCNRAACYCAISLDKHFIQAIIDVERAIELDPSYAKAYGRLGWICHQKGGIAKAIINYQRGINCLENTDKENMDRKTSKQLQLYQQEIKLCQEKALCAISDPFTFHSNLTKETLLFKKERMKQKYRNYMILSTLGIPEKQIPSYTGSKIDGEKPLSLNDILTEITLMVRLLAENPKGSVQCIDESLRNAKQNISNLDMDDIKQSVDDIGNKQPDDKDEIQSNVYVDHTFKYEKIKELQEQKKQIEDVRLKMDKNELEGRGMMGLMEWKYQNKINKIKEAIENNESDEEFERYYDDELNEDDDMMGYPDCMAKRLLFEHGLNPWDDGVDAVLAKMYNW